MHRSEHSAFIRGGVAVALGQLEAALQEVVLTLLRGGRERRQHVRNGGQFLEHAVRSLAVGFAANDTAFGIGVLAS